MQAVGVRPHLQANSCRVSIIAAVLESQGVFLKAVGFLHIKRTFSKASSVHGNVY